MTELQDDLRLLWARAATITCEVCGREVRRGTVAGSLAAADWIIEMGPGGGRHGGRVVAEGPPATLAKGATATGAVLRAAMG
jgi:excinuclease UvrABC ATPase subunit